MSEKICMTDGCERVAVVNPRMILRLKNYSGEPAMAIIGLDLCFICKGDLKKSDIFDGPGWDDMCNAFLRQGKVKPNKKASTFDFVDIDELPRIMTEQGVAKDEN